MSSKFLDKTGMNTLWAKIKSTFQTLGNLVTAWGSTPSDTKYPSEKLVKTSLDAKAADSAVLHKAGLETASGQKWFEGGFGVFNSSHIGYGHFTLAGAGRGPFYNDWTEEQKDGAHFREWSLSFNSGVNFWGKIRITIATSFSGFNASGSMQKTINCAFNTMTVFNNTGYYNDLGINSEKEFRISDLIWNNTTKCWEIKIHSIKPTSNNRVPVLLIEFWTFSTSNRDSALGIHWVSTSPSIVTDTTYYTKRSGNASTSPGTGGVQFNWADEPVFQSPYGYEIFDRSHTIPVGNGGTGKTTAKAAEYNLTTGKSEISDTTSGDDRVVFELASPSESNGVTRGFRKLSTIWTWIKGLLSSESGVNISGTASGLSATLGVGKGGTGRTSVTAGSYVVGAGTSALVEKTPKEVGSNVLSSLDDKSNASSYADFVDGDFVVGSDHVDASTISASTFVRRTALNLWNYVAGKISSVLGLTASSYGGNAATATKATQDSDGNVINTTYLKELYQAEYGVSTFADIYAAVMAKKTVYCKVPGGSGGNGARMAFLAYTNVSNPPTSSSNIEFQYYRSNSSGTGDSVFVYTITNNNNTWTTVERAASSSVKGNAESTYRTGQVNLTPANLGISATTSSVTVGSTTFNKYTHPTTSGNKHVPSGGSSGQFLGWDSDGTAKWVANPNTDTKVKATAKSDNANYKILATASASPTSGAATEAVYDTDITLNPSTNTITANVSGNAATATSANITRTADTTNGDKLQIGSGTAVNVVNSKSTLNVAASAALTNTSARHIWFSDSSTETKRAYSGDLTYRTDTNTISANISGNAATATTATNYNTSSGNINTALNGKSSTSHTHSVSINGRTKTIAASGGTAVDLGTYKVFNYARVYATQTYNANTNRYILLAFRSTTYTNNWEESSMFKLVVNDGQVPKELVFRLWLTGNIPGNEVPPDPSNPKLYRVYSENFSTSALNILDVRLFVVEKSTASIKFTIGIFIDRNYLQARYVSYQLYPLSYSTYDRGNTIDNGLSSWTYTVGNNSYYENIMHDNVFTTVFEVSDLPISMNIVDAYELQYLTGPITSLNPLKLPNNIICPYGYTPQPGGSYIALSQFVKNKTHRFELWEPTGGSVWIYNNLGVTIVYRAVTASGYAEYNVLARDVIILNGSGSRVQPTSAWATLIGTNLYVTYGY